jgi:2-octaprenyl-6-methoxyphenol hydroxylase
MAETVATFDVIIAGGGLVGRSLALALAGLAPDGFKVALVDAAPQAVPVSDARASAISAASKSLLTVLGVWPSVALDAEPITGIDITDSPLDAVFRSHLLGFDEDGMVGGEPGAFIVPNAGLERALCARLEEMPLIVSIAPQTVARFAAGPFAVSVTLGNGETLNAKLLVAADGKRSRLREQAKIKCVGWSYPQVGIVTTVAHSRPHGGRAVQHFLPAGPFAILPMTGNRSSIVWTERKERAAEILRGGDAALLSELATRFGHRLGDIAVAGPWQSFPLDMQLARSFVADRFALIGDAAHVVHPLAGQGLNIGMRDVAALTETIVDAARLGLDIGAATQLERYERWRRFDSAFSAAVMDGLNRLFSNDNAPLRALRDFGLGIVDRAPALKRFLVREAAGATGEVPRLLKGERI